MITCYDPNLNFKIKSRVDNVMYSQQQKQSLEHPYVLKHAEDKEEIK
jgi:hypothetical protein